MPSMVPGSADDRIGDGGTFPPIPFGVAGAMGAKFTVSRKW